jgi:hypothetical protein
MDLYMSTLSQFAGGGGKPKQVTVYTSGSGTYTPTAPNSWCRVTLIGGGGSGGGTSVCYGTNYGTHGIAGQWLQQWTKVVSTAAYTVGNAGIWYQTGTYPYYSMTQNSPGASSFNGISCAAGSNGGGYTTIATHLAYIPMSLGIYNHGASYGRGGGGAGASNGSGCTGFNIGGNGVGGFILVEDFGP